MACCSPKTDETQFKPKPERFGKRGMSNAFFFRHPSLMPVARRFCTLKNLWRLPLNFAPVRLNLARMNPEAKPQVGILMGSDSD
jgi:hypothetical protein